MRKLVTEKGPNVKMDKAAIQKEIISQAFELISQISMDDVADVDFTTSEIGDTFHISLSIEMKNPEV